MMEKRLELWIDTEFRDVAEHMALDEALFLSSMKSGTTRARFYHWNREAATVGYFHDFESNPLEDASTPVCRRMTGGGLVEHGKDVTFVLAFPENASITSLPGPTRYGLVHQALELALSASGIPAMLIADPPHSNGPCFVTPVPQDIISPDGSKIAGGAQRKSRGAVIHQGSVRLDPPFRDLRSKWIQSFVQNLSESVESIPSEDLKLIENEAVSLQVEKYGSENWNRLSVQSRIN